MSRKTHSYDVTVTWTGNLGKGTMDYGSYARDHEIVSGRKPVISASSDPAFRGDAGRYNPEDLLVSSLSACHMLWYLHLCAEAGVIVVSYVDRAGGTLVETREGGGHFSEVILRPLVIITDESRIPVAKDLHDKAHHLCFIANSVNFPVRCEPDIRATPADSENPTPRP